jgi:large subunit ribosomal protein L29
MKMKDLQGLSMDDLRKKLKDSRQELFNLRFQMATGQLQNHRQIRHVRTDLARILTEIHMKERNGDPSIAASAPAVQDSASAVAAAPGPSVQDSARARRGRRAASAEESA